MFEGLRGAGHGLKGFLVWWKHRFASAARPGGGSGGMQVPAGRAVCVPLVFAPISGVLLSWAGGCGQLVAGTS